jgi:hypothetical protein
LESFKRTQLKALEEDGVLSSSADRALPLLAKIASSTNAFPTQRAFKALRYGHDLVEEGGSAYYGEPGVRIKVLKQSRMGVVSRLVMGTLRKTEYL